MEKSVNISFLIVSYKAFSAFFALITCIMDRSKCKIMKSVLYGPLVLSLFRYCRGWWQWVLSFSSRVSHIRMKRKRETRHLWFLLVSHSMLFQYRKLRLFLEKRHRHPKVTTLSFSGMNVLFSMSSAGEPKGIWAISSHAPLIFHSLRTALSIIGL